MLLQKVRSLLLRLAADIIGGQPTTILRDWMSKPWAPEKITDHSPLWIQVIKKGDEWHVRQYDCLGIMDYVTDLGDQLSPNTLSAQEKEQWHDMNNN